MQSRSKEVKDYNRWSRFYEHHSYKYYDTPDGQDFLKKLWYTTKLGMKGGYIVGGFYAVANRNKSLSRIWLLHDFFRVGTPFVVASATYTVTTFWLTEYRKVDDEHNAQVGGAAAGLILGSWFKKPGIAVGLALLGAYLCGLKKMAVMADIAFPHTDYQRMVESSWSLRNLDFTLTKDYSGNWTSIPPTRPEPPPLPPPTPPPPPPPSICDSFKITKE